MKSILLDPGHGGPKTGHISPTGLMEKHLALATCEAIAGMLDPERFEPFFTRIKDEDVSHSERARMAAVSDATISIHWHVNANPHVHDIVAGARVAAGEALGRLLLDHLAKETGESPHCMRYRPVLTHIVKVTNNPVVILTCGNMSNPNVEHELLEGYRLEAVAAAVASGLAQHYS